MANATFNCQNDILKNIKFASHAERQKHPTYYTVPPMTSVVIVYNNVEDYDMIANLRADGNMFVLTLYKKDATQPPSFYRLTQYSTSPDQRFIKLATANVSHNMPVAGYRDNKVIVDSIEDSENETIVKFRVECFVNRKIYPDDGYLAPVTHTIAPARASRAAAISPALPATMLVKTSWEPAKQLHVIALCEQNGVVWELD